MRIAAVCALTVLIGAILVLADPARAGACPEGMARIGKLCVDRYEASIWSKPTGGVQYGVTSANYPCDPNGQDCDGQIFARSVKGVMPSRGATWFQALAALANSGKRLPTNAEWQMAVQGTPDAVATPGAEDCNTDATTAIDTGSAANCVSDHGMFDMVGNAHEWVADWSLAPVSCTTWGTFSDDQLCFVGVNEAVDYPVALLRGGAFHYELAAGPFSLDRADPKEFDMGFVRGFRGVR